MTIVNYLGVSLNLSNLNYKPCHKPDNEILYIHKDSNHPPSILKQIPTSIEKIIQQNHIFANQKKYTKKI